MELKSEPLKRRVARPVILALQTRLAHRAVAVVPAEPMHS